MKFMLSAVEAKDEAGVEGGKISQSEGLSAKMRVFIEKREV